MTYRDGGNSNFSRITVAELRKRAEAADMLDHPGIQGILRLWPGRPSEHYLRLFELLIRKELQKKAIDGLPQTPAPKATAFAGAGISVAKTEPHQAEYGFRDSDLASGVLIVGPQQVGKSKLCQMIGSTKAGEVPIICCDPKDRLRQLKSIHANTYVIPVAEWECNFFEPPPGMPLRTWLDVFSEVYTESASLLDLSQSMFITVFNELHQRFQNAGITHLPTLADMAEYMRGLGKRWGPSTQAAERLHLRISMLDSALPGITRTASGMTLDPFIESNAIVVFEQIGKIQDQRLFGMWLTNYLYHYLVRHPDRSKKLRALLVVDEATRLLAMESGARTQSGNAVEIMTRHQELGLGTIFVAHQTNGALNDTVKANSGIKMILGGMGNNDDLYDFGVKCMGIQKEWVEYVPRLKMQEAIVKEARWPFPFKIRIKNVNELPAMANLREVSDEEVAEDMKKVRAMMPTVAHQGKSNEGTPKIQMPVASEEDKKFMMLVHLLPLEPLSRYYAQLNWNESKGSKLVKKLLVLNWLYTEPFSRSNGGPLTFCCLTPLGRQIIGMDRENDGGKGRGGPFHRQWVVFLKKYFETQGWECKIEVEIQGRHVDLLLRKDGKTACVECVVKSEDAHNLNTALEDAKVFDHVYMYFREKSQRTAIEPKLPPEIKPKFTLGFLSDLMLRGD